MGPEVSTTPDGFHRSEDDHLKSSTLSALLLPVEVFHHIFSILFEVHQPSPNACMLVSRAFFDMASPILYRNIRIAVYPKQNFNFFESRMRRLRSLPVEFHHQDDVNTNTGNDQDTRKTKLKQYARVITVDAHDNSACRNETLQRFPKLDILRLKLLPLGSITYFPLPLVPIDMVPHPTVCELIADLEPRKLVLDHQSIHDLQRPDLPVPLEVFHRVEKLTLIAPSVVSLQCPENSSKPVPNTWTLYATPNQALKVMTWIFSTDSSYPYWVPHKPIDYAFGHDHVKTITSDELLFLGNLVASCPQDSTLNIVNAGSIHPDMLNLSATDSDVIHEQGVMSGPKNAIDYDIIERALKHEIEHRITEVVRNGARPFVRRKGEEKMNLEKIEDGFKRTKWMDMKTYLSENE